MTQKTKPAKANSDKAKAPVGPTENAVQGIATQVAGSVHSAVPPIGKKAGPVEKPPEPPVIKPAEVAKKARR